MKTESGNRAFGKALRAWRERRRWSQQQMAFALGCSVSVISKWETGERRPTVMVLKKAITQLTGIDPDAEEFASGGDGEREINAQ